MQFLKTLFRREENDSGRVERFHPRTVIRDFGNGDAFRIEDAITGTFICGATGSGKTSGPGKSLAIGCLAAGVGGLVLSAKPDEAARWKKWAAEAGREDDLMLVDAAGTYRFNCIAWEANRPSAGGGFAANVVNLLHQLAGALNRASGQSDKGGGDSNFWEEALRLLLNNLVNLPILAGLEVSLPLLRSVLSSAPISLAQLSDPAWQENSICAAMLREADKATIDARDPCVRSDFEECRTYFQSDFAQLSEKTRSVIVLTFSILTHSFVTSPLRKLFCSDTNIKPEDTFDGKIIIIDLPVQDFGVVGKVAALTWKLCFQAAVLRRAPPESGFLRPVFLWADECQVFVTEGDAEYQAVARSSGGCTFYLTQNRELLRHVLGSADAVDSLLGNLQCKIFCQNGSVETNEWSAKLFGERFLNVTSTNVGQSYSQTSTQNAGVSRSEQRRYFVEPARFTTLRRGGAGNSFLVDAIVYNGGRQFAHVSEMLPYRLLTFNQIA